MSCTAAHATLPARIDIDKTHYPMYAEAVLDFVFHSNRLHLLYQVLDILCTDVHSRDSPSRHFVAAIQASDQRQPLQLALIALMADQVKQLAICICSTTTMHGEGVFYACDVAVVS